MHDPNASQGRPQKKARERKRTSQKLHDPQARMQVRKGSFAVAAISNWNVLFRNVLDNKILKQSNLTLTQFDGAESWTSTEASEGG